MAPDVLHAFDALAPALRRRPDVEAHDLVAADASDRLILASAGLGDAPAEAVVIGDRYGGLTLPLVAAGHRVRVHQDALSGERAARLNAVEAGLADGGRVGGIGQDGPVVAGPESPAARRGPGAHAEAAHADAVDVRGATWHGLDRELVAGAGLVLMQLPRSLDALEEIAALVADHAHPDVRIVAGGRTKHMTPAMNDVLGRHFEAVTADRGVGKSRVLRASGPRRGGSAGWPRTRHDPDTGLVVCAHGAAFAGTAVDIGTRLLLGVLADAPDAARAVDLGCGTGVIAAAYALAHRGAGVIASDQSAAAVASARATAAANGALAPTPGDPGITVVRDDALGAQPDGSAGLVLLNPPFHSGAAVTDRIAPRLFADAARVLRPGGELWCVWNSHLRYRPHLERIVGPTRQIARNAKFTVTASTRR